jgi:hypothetical protein
MKFNLSMTPQVIKHFTWIVCLAVVMAIGCKKQSPPPPSSADNKQPGSFSARLANLAAGQPPSSVNDPQAVLPGRHLSENQVAGLVFKELPQTTNFSCAFKDGMWEILEPQTGVWGVASRTTNAEGKIMVRSTNATRVILRVRDADGKVEPVANP